MRSLRWLTLWLIVVTGGLIPIFTSAQATVPEETYQELNVELTEHHVIPRYQRLTEATSALDFTARRLCPAPDQDGMEALRENYHQAMDAWMGVQHIQFGAVKLFMRSHRFFFGPDHRGYVAQQLDELLSKRDREILHPDQFRNASVAVQGLPALEQLRFADNAPEQLLAGNADSAYRCALIKAITENLRDMAAGILEGWQSGDNPYDQLVASPGEDNVYYESAQQVTLDFFKSLHGGLQLIADIKLKPVLGDSPAPAHPQRAESWRSQRSLSNMVINLQALRALYLGEDGTGFTDLVQDYGDDPGLDPLLRKAFAMTLETAHGIDQSLSTAVQDAAVRPQVEKLSTQVLALKQIIRTRLAQALDLTVGFNAFDGD